MAAVAVGFRGPKAPTRVTASPPPTNATTSTKTPEPAAPPSVADHDVGKQEAADPEAGTAIAPSAADEVALRVTSEPDAVLIVGDERILLPSTLHRPRGTTLIARVEKPGFEPVTVELAFDGRSRERAIPLTRTEKHGGRGPSRSQGSFHDDGASTTGSTKSDASRRIVLPDAGPSGGGSRIRMK